MEQFHSASCKSELNEVSPPYYYKLIYLLMHFQKYLSVLSSQQNVYRPYLFGCQMSIHKDRFVKFIYLNIRLLESGVSSYSNDIHHLISIMGSQHFVNHLNLLDHSCLKPPMHKNTAIHFVHIHSSTSPTGTTSIKILMEHNAGKFLMFYNGGKFRPRA